MPIAIDQMPHVTAGLNALASVFLILGFYFVKKGDKATHKKCMLAAIGISVAFLVVYTTYHAMGGFAKFGGEGAVRPVYFTILAAHVIMAVVITPLVPLTLVMALKGNFARHRKWARWTWPIWVYVSVSGVVVYVMAIHLYPTISTG